MEAVNFSQNDLIQLKNNVEIIKNLLIVKDIEGELTNWASNELRESREEYKTTSLDDLKKEIEDEL